MSVQEKRPAKRRRIQHESRENQLGFQRFNKFFTSPDAPIIFGSYTRVVFHSIGISILLYVLLRILQSFTSEIQARYFFEIDELAEKAHLCHKNYVNHNCGPELKGAIWQSYCDEWDRQFQPQTVGKTKIAAQVFGEVMNGFVEPLSLKAMLIICLLLFGFFIISSLIAL